MLNEFKIFITENKLVKPGDRVLLAVSGGIDSMTMAHLFLRLGYKTAIAHCNFSLRAEESDKDEAMVHSYADQNNIPFHSIRFATKAFAKKEGMSVQMAARDLRYNWFEVIRQENNYDSVAVAHNLNDNIETFIINLTRGTGITGLTGIKPCSNNIIRPLLFATRNSITDYCNRHQIIFREDRSNADTKYTRNKIRHLVIPVLKEINPSVENTLRETAGRFTEISEIVSEYISAIRKSVSEEKGVLTTFSISSVKNYLHNKTVLYELFKPFGINNVQLNDLIKVTVGKTGGQIFTASHRIIKNRKELIAAPKVTNGETLFYVRNITELRKVQNISSASYADVTGKFIIPSDPLTACLDTEKISFPMIIRKWKTGDHFYPLGMEHKKKLSDYFIDSKYSQIDKENILILESAGEIAWVIGDRIDNRVKLTSTTTKALVIKTIRH
jgi:tRNA(Ile)-lysidine synthase